MLPHLAETDFREPLFVFTLQSEDDNTSSVEYGLYVSSIPFWVELLGMLTIQTVVAALTGLLLFKTIIEPKRIDTNTALLIGFGVVIPFWIVWPVILMQLLDMRNTIFKFLIGCVMPILCIFRTTECIYGFAPIYTRKSAWDYISYYSSVLLLAHDTKGKPIPCPSDKVLRHLRNFVIFQFITGAIQSILTPYPNLAIFGDTDDWYGLRRYKTWQLYANNFVHSILFQMYLTTYGEGLILGFTALTGYEAQPVMLNPLFESKSPSDFWGRRWNKVVHAVLKNGVFKPVRKHFSKTIAVLATFLASGLFHEWLLWAIFTPTRGQIDPNTGECASSCFHPTYGSAIVFFIWQAAVIAIEMILGNTFFFKQLGAKLPQIVKTPLLACLGLPVVHFFTEPYFRCGFFFLHGSPALTMILQRR